MRKRLLCSLLFCGMFVAGLYAQDKSKVVVLGNLTSMIANADFSAGTPVANTVRTYDYDMEDNGLGSGEEGAVGLYGQQEVPGWTAVNPTTNTKVADRTDGTNARAAGLYAYADIDNQYGLGGAYFVPVPGEEESGNALGLVSVWGGDLKYSQTVTLPAGDYMLVIRMQNVAGAGEVTTNMGFVTADGSGKYMSDVTKYEKFFGAWENDTILFRLTGETTGDITLGFKFGAGSGSAPHLFLDNVKLYSIDTNVLDQAAIDAAKEELLELIEKGNYYEADTEASQAVYDNPVATLAEVLAAIEAQKEINAKATTDLSAFFIKNAHFSEGEAVIGGICTYGKDCTTNGVDPSNFSMLDVPGWTQNKTDDGAAGGVFAVGSDAFLGGKGYNPPATLSDGVTTEANLLGVVTCWSMSAQYTQMVSLPAGKYIISISYYNSGGSSAVAKNLMGFIDNDGNEYLGETKTFPAGKWTSEVINFELDEETSGYFTLGYQSTNSGSSAMPHLFVDGFSLVYIGTGINASLFALQAAVSAADKALDEDFYEGLRKPLENAVDAAKALVNSTSSDDEANLAALDQINALLVDVNASIEAYKKLDEFYMTDLTDAVDKYNKNTYPDLYATLNALDESVGDALDNLTWTTAQIEETIASLPALLKEGVQTAWDAAIASGAVLAEDIDISVLFDQLAYTYSTTVQQGANVPDKEWKYGTATNFKTQYGTAEVWSQSPFTISRTLADMPAGKYTITTKAFFRNGSNADNYVNYDETNTPEASLFAGYTMTGLANVAILASEDGAEQTGWVEAGEEMGVYVPNTQQAAYNIFNNDEYTDLLQRSASTVLTSAGDLTFGVTGDNLEDNSWTVWYTFSVTYNAPQNADLYDHATALYNALSNVADRAEENNLADSKTQGALSDYENITPSSTKEALLAEIAALSEALDYTNEYMTLRSELDQVYDLYKNFLIGQELVVSEEPTYNALLEDVEAAFVDGFSDNEQVSGYIAAIKDGYVPFVQYPFLETASLNEPGNITPVIYNFSFVDPYTQENNANGWTREFKGGKEDKSNDVYEFYNNENFKIYQTIKGLAEGYYRIRVQSFYRGANTPKDMADSLAIDPEFGKYVYLFGETETGSWGCAVKNIFQREDESAMYELGSEVGVEGEQKVAYGGMEAFYVPGSRSSFYEYTQLGMYWNQVEVFVAAGESLTLGLTKPDNYVTGDWCPFDNFELYYLGTTAPTGIENVERDMVVTQDKPAAIYNLAGQRVGKAVKGLYIIGGKKVLVK